MTAGETAGPADSGGVTPTVERRLTIRNKRGLHARASAKFVGTAGKFKSRITASRDGIEVCATSIMGLMMLAAGLGEQIDIRAAGEDAAAAIDALTALINDKFGEE